MRTEIRDSDDHLLATVALVDNEAVLESATPAVVRFLRDLNVVMPGKDRTPSRPVTMADGADYLRTLPLVLRGPYASATFFD